MIRSTYRLDSRAVSSGLAVSDKPGLLEYLAERAAAVYGLERRPVLAALDARERLGSTGFGGRVAFPHAKLSGPTTPLALLVRLARPLDFGAPDGLPVDIAACLLSPRHAGTMHLKALAELSRVLRQEQWLAKIRGAADADAIYAVLAGIVERDAA